MLNLICEVWPHFREIYSAEHLRGGIRRRVHRRDARVMVEKGRVISNAQVLYSKVSVYGCQFKVASIGCVCTREDRRGKGLASVVLEHCLAEMNEGGSGLLYVSGDRSLYRRNHCVHAGRFFMAELNPKSLPPSTVALTARRVNCDEWPALAPLYQAEPVRFVRRAEFLSETCFWWDDCQPEIWAIECDGCSLAYLVIRPPWDDRSQEPTRVVMECAGSRAAMLGGLPALFEAEGISRIRLPVAGEDRELIHLLGRLGIGLSPITLPDHTIRILDLPGLMRKLRPHLAGLLSRVELRRLSFDQKGENCTFAYADERAEMNLSEAALVVFEGAEAPRVCGALGRVLSRVFPLPIPAPGCNHI